MRIALLADIHGNLAALEAVLKHAGGRGCEAFWHAGDAVGYGPSPEAVVLTLREIGAVSVLGNYDRKVLEAGRRPLRARVSDPRKAFSFLWTFSQLSEESLVWLRELPGQRSLEARGRWALLVHGSPDSDKEYLLESTPDERFAEIARRAGTQLVIAGHTHQPLLRKAAGALFVNPGSVGRPDDGDARAAYSVLTLGPRTMRVVHYRIEYDVARTVQSIRRLGLPEDFAHMVLSGRALEELPEGRKDPGRPGGRDRLAKALGCRELSPHDLVAQEERRQAVRRFAQSYPCDMAHTEHVVHLALRLFDELQDIHGLGARERFWLEAASLVHDIGWSAGRRRHHIRALQFVLNAEDLPFGARERLIIGSIARYHRRALPLRRRHAHFAALARADRTAVVRLAALLRVADALDFTHQGLVPDIEVETANGAIVIHCRSPRAMGELHSVERKGLLIAVAFGRKLQVTWDRRTPRPLR